jgi:predicted  nucleic acid-binding Zn-ribbon protein
LHGNEAMVELFVMNENFQAQIARLESDVQHIRTKLSDIKFDLRRIDDKLDAMELRINGRIDRLTEKVNGLR